MTTPKYTVYDSIICWAWDMFRFNYEVQVFFVRENEANWWFVPNVAGGVYSMFIPKW